MQQTVEAIYENGILRPLKSLENLLKEHSKVTITIEAKDEANDANDHYLAQFAGILNDEEAQELKHIIDVEFENIDPNVW